MDPNCNESFNLDLMNETEDFDRVYNYLISQDNQSQHNQSQEQVEENENELKECEYCK